MFTLLVHLSHAALLPLSPLSVCLSVKSRFGLIALPLCSPLALDVTVSDKLCLGLKASNIKLPPCKVGFYVAIIKVQGGISNCRGNYCRAYTRHIYVK